MARVNSRGFELSIGTIVWLIIILIVFSGSLLFIRQFFVKIPAVGQQIDKDTEAQISELLRQGQPVAIPINKRTTVRGGEENFWLGIENMLNRENDFRLAVTFDSAYDIRERPIINAEPEFITRGWLLYDKGPYKIPNAVYRATPIRVAAGTSMAADGTTTERGYYVFNVCVYHTSQTPPCTQAQADATPDQFYTGKLYKIILEVA